MTERSFPESLIGQIFYCWCQGLLKSIRIIMRFHLLFWFIRILMRFLLMKDSIIRKKFRLFCWRSRRMLLRWFRQDGTIRWFGQFLIWWNLLRWLESNCKKFAKVWLGIQEIRWFLLVSWIFIFIEFSFLLKLLKAKWKDDIISKIKEF